MCEITKTSRQTGDYDHKGLNYKDNEMAYKCFKTQLK